MTSLPGDGPYIPNPKSPPGRLEGAALRELLQFEHREPSGSQIAGQAVEVGSWASKFQQLHDDVASEHKKARSGVGGGPTTTMKTASGKAEKMAEQMRRRATVALGALNEFAEAVSAFNAKVDGWNGMIQCAVDDETARELFHRYRPEYEDREDLRDAAARVQSRLEGWRDDDTLKDLWDAGALPDAVKDQFPDAVSDENSVDELVDSLIDDGVLPHRASDWDADQLQDWLIDNPDKAEKLTDNSPDVDGSHLEEMLAGLLPQKGDDNTDPKQRQGRMNNVREFFDSLDGDDASKLAMLFPAQVGNLNGVPFKQRGQANSVSIAVAEAKEEDGSKRQKLYDNILNSITDPKEDSRQIVLFNPAGDGKIAELHGDIDENTQNVGTLVPGTGTDMGNFQGIADRSQSFQEEGGKNLAMISWLGGDMPDDVAPDAFSAHYSQGMASELAGFSDALRQEVDHSAAANNSVDTAYVGHSYGGATMGLAEKYGLDADRVVHVESAGMGHNIGSPEDLPDSQDDVDRYSLTAPGDPISLSQGLRQFEQYGLGHGADPNTFDGTTRLDTGNDQEGEPLHGTDAHVDVFKRHSDAWESQFDAITGNVSSGGEYEAPGVGEVTGMAVNDAAETYADSIGDEDPAPLAMLKASGTVASYGPAAADAGVNAVKEEVDTVAGAVDDGYQATKDWGADRVDDVKDGYGATKDKLSEGAEKVGEGAKKAGEGVKSAYDWAKPW